jgi:hypothetical protein
MYMGKGGQVVLRFEDLEAALKAIKDAEVE